MLKLPESIIDILKKDFLLKNFRAHFPNGEREDLTNHNVEYESVEFTESICSKKSLKFGLCESSVLKFTTINNVENLSGMTIEACYEIDVTDLVKSGFEDYMESEDVSFPFVRIPLGKFVVKDCKRQGDMTRRKVVAYSDKVNKSVEFSPFEKAKISLKLNKSTSYVYNPVHLALCNVSQNVNLSLDSEDFKVFDGISSSKGELEEITIGPPYTTIFSPAENHIFEYVEKYSVHVKVDVLKWNLLNYKDSDSLLAYKMGEQLCDAEYIISSFEEMISPYRYLVDLYDYQNNKCIQNILSFCHPFGYIQPYNNGSSVIYGGDNITGRIRGMRDHGFITPKFSGITGNFYMMCFPHRITFEIVKVLTGSHDEEVMDTQSFDLYDTDGIDVRELTNSVLSGNSIFIPNITATATRTKTPTGEYVLNEEQFPDTMDVFKALLELNACFLKINRDAVYNLVRLNGDIGTYPGEDLYPGYDVYLREPDNVISTSEYRSAWYDDYMVEPYTSVAAKYVDQDGNECNSEYHAPVYSETFIELLSAGITYDSIPTATYDEYIFDLTVDNPLENGSTLLIECGGLLISYVELIADAQIMVEIPVEQGANYVECTLDNWEDASGIKIGYDVSEVNEGETVTITVKSVTRTEIEENAVNQYNTFDLSQNYLIKNYPFNEDEIIEILKNVFNGVSELSYMSANIDMIGMPWIESGDSIWVDTKDGIISTYALRRTLKGIMALKDNIESK